MRRFLLCVLIAVAFGMGISVATAEHRLGVGAHYLTTVDDIEVEGEEIDTSALAWSLTYQYRTAAIVGLELDIERFPADFGGATDVVYAPQAFLLIGAGIYGGIGIGGYYSDSEFGSDPFYALKAGVDIEILPSVRLDINANYRFMEWESINDLENEVDTDTVTVGAAVRIAF